MNLMTRISVLAQKFRGEDQKKIRGDDQKKFSALNLRLRLGVHLCVLFWNETLLTLGGAQAVFGGELAPKSIPVVAPGMILSFGAQSSFGYANFSFGKAQAVIW